MSTFTLVQPRVRRREWELRRGDEVRGVLRLSTFRSAGDAEAAGRPLSIEQRGWWRPEYVVCDGRMDEEVARLRRNELELDGKTVRWKRFGRRGGAGFVDGSGEPLVTVKVKTAFVRFSGEVTVAATVTEQDSLAMALLAMYLLFNRSAAAVAGATAAAGAMRA